jgi:membrane-bound serine protease (ClpP class)
LGLSFLPINYVGALLILLAIGLFIAEVKVQGFGILGFGGVAAMVLGMVILIDTPDPAVKIGLSTALALALPFAAIFMLLLVALLKSLKLKVSTGDAGMIGLIGQAETDIGADGRVKVRGEHWRARSEVPIAAGRPVRITEIENLTLKVEEVKN